MVWVPRCMASTCHQPRCTTSAAQVRENSLQCQVFNWSGSQWKPKIHHNQSNDGWCLGQVTGSFGFYRRKHKHASDWDHIRLCCTFLLYVCKEAWRKAHDGGPNQDSLIESAIHASRSHFARGIVHTNHMHTSFRLNYSTQSLILCSILYHIQHLTHC